VRSFKEFFLFIETLNPYEVLGVKPGDDMETIKRAYREKAKKTHPDMHFGDPKMGEEFKKVQIAWEELKEKPSARRTEAPRHQTYEGTPPWETDWRSTYHEVGNDHRNLNFNKKYIYEKALEAGSELKKMTIWAFDGNFQRGVFSVWGSNKVYPEMAKAMHIWNSHGGNPHRTEAILVSEGGDFRIIWIKGHDVNIPVNHDSFNQNAFNDQSFVRDLQRIIKNFEPKKSFPYLR